MSMGPLLLLWDVDGTLVSESRSGITWYADAVARVLGREHVEQPARTAGLTDYAIIQELLIREGFDDDRTKLLIPAALFELDELSSSKVDWMRGDRDELPGVRALLQGGIGEEHLHGLLTGNTRRRALSKLISQDLDGYFDVRFGGFGDRTADRWRLVDEARLRAGLIVHHDAEAFGRGRVILIGDTPSDVLAAREAGVGIVAVATGKFDRRALSEHEPQLLLDDLEMGAAELMRFLELRANGAKV